MQAFTQLLRKIPARTYQIENTSSIIMTSLSIAAFAFMLVVAVTTAWPVRVEKPKPLYPAANMQLWSEVSGKERYQDKFEDMNQVESEGMEIDDGPGDDRDDNDADAKATNFKEGRAKEDQDLIKVIKALYMALKSMKAGK